MAGDVKAGGMFVTLSLQSTQFSKQLELAERRLGTIGKSIAGLGTRFAALGGAGIAAFVPAIKAASDAQEEMSKFETVFGAQTEAMKAFAATLANELGRSEKQIAQFLGSSQDLFIPLGFDEGTATDLSKTLTRLSVDLASFNNVADTKALDDLQAALTGSGEVMKKYGVLVNEAAVKQKLLSQSIDPATASDQQKVFARLAIILAGTTAAQGDAVRTSGSFANQMKRLQGILEDTAVTIGSALLPPLTQVLQFINNNVGAVKQWIAANEGLVKGIFFTAAGVAALGIALVGIGGTIAVIGSAFGALLAPIGIITSLFGALLPIVTALISPIGLLAAAVAAFGVVAINSFGGVGAVIEALKDRFSGLVADFGVAISAIGNALAAGDIAKAGDILWLTLKLLWEQGVASLNATWLEWKSYFLGIWIEATSALAGYLLKGVSSVQSTWTQMTDYLLDGWTTVTGKIADVWRTVQQAIAGGILTLASLFDSEFDLDGALKALNEDFQGRSEQAQQARDDAIIGRQRKREAALEALNADQDAALQALEDDRKARLAAVDQNEQSGLAETQKRLDAARQAWLKAVETTEGAKNLTEAGIAVDSGDNPFQSFLDSLEGAGEGVAAVASNMQRTAFGGARAGQIFGNESDIPKKQLDVQKAMLKEQQRTNEQLKLPGGLVFG